VDRITTAAVVGAGVMGAGIAAHLANAGIPVLLLDIVPNEGRRDALAEAALERLKRSDPPAFMHRSAAALVTSGNVEDHLGRLAEADWIIEAVVEDLEVKRTLLARVAAVAKPGAVVSSNTSTLTRAALARGLGPEVSRRLLVTHFFNPPRYIRLLELVAGPEADPDAVTAVMTCAEERLGKAVVAVEDRPGLIANRIGSYWIQSAVAAALELGLTVEEADAITAAAFGVPKTGVFGLLDLVGLDLAQAVAASFRAQLPPDDPCHALPSLPGIVRRMIAEGRTGRKGAGGFYRLVERPDGERVKEALDLTGDTYRPASRRPRLASLEASPKDHLRALLNHPDRGGRFAARVVMETLAYAAHAAPEIAADVALVDRALRLGYGWAAGPFELLDRLGPSRTAERLRRAGRPVPGLLEEVGTQTFYRRIEGSPTAARDRRGGYRELRPRPGTLRLEDVKGRRPPVASNPSASLWDLENGIACFELHTKLNTLDRDGLAMLRNAVEDEVPRGFRALIIGGDAEHFSAGVNLGLALYAANLAAWTLLEETVELGQRTFQALKYAPFPIVGAPSGMALGGGCELLLHCDAIEAHAESYIGLVEAGVGLVPAWGGSTQYLIRWLSHPDRPGGPTPAVTKAFETIALARVSTSAAEARGLLFLRPGDGIVMNRDRVLASAKARALTMAEEGYRPPPRPTVRLPGRAARIALKLAIEGYRRLGKASAHDALVARYLAEILTGGDTDPTGEVGEDDLLALERSAVMVLIRTPATLARMEHMLETGKPLRN
jgi:3-hydroxyacyl-CoA dehydrogenase